MSIVAPKRHRRPVANWLPDSFLAGGSPPDLSKFEEAMTEGPDAEASPLQIDAALLSRLKEEALRRHVDDLDAMDGWLAPRLHSAVRVSRRTASDKLFWSWLAIAHGSPYVHARWADPRTGLVKAWRYTGDLLRNGLSRLWWGAELARNGADYGDVERVFRRVRTAQFALELRYSWYRPAAIAFARVAEPDDGEPLTDDQKRLLSSRINAYLSTLVLEAMATEEGQGREIDEVWYQTRPTIQQLLEDDPIGPEEGRVSEETISKLVDWFAQLVPVGAAASDT